MLDLVWINTFVCANLKSTFYGRELRDGRARPQATMRKCKNAFIRMTFEIRANFSLLTNFLKSELEYSAHYTYMMIQQIDVLRHIIFQFQKQFASWKTKQIIIKLGKQKIKRKRVNKKIKQNTSANSSPINNPEFPSLLAYPWPFRNYKCNMGRDKNIVHAVTSCLQFTFAWREHKCIHYYFFFSLNVRFFRFKERFFPSFDSHEFRQSARSELTEKEEKETSSRENVQFIIIMRYADSRWSSQ